MDTAAGARRVMRGGSWHCGAGGGWVAFRRDLLPGDRFDGLGFRLLRLP